MKTIEIKAKPFFELLKTRETSMWSMFAEMINEQEKQLIRFLDEEGKEIVHYILPTSKEQLDIDQKSFANSFKEKLNADKIN